MKGVEDRYSIEFALPRDTPHHLLGLCILLDREDSAKQFDTLADAEFETQGQTSIHWKVGDNRHYHRIVTTGEGTILNLDDIRTLLSGWSGAIRINPFPASPCT